MARIWTDRSLTGSLVISLAIFLLGSTTGYLAIGRSWAEGAGTDGGFVLAPGSFQAIILANLGAALLLYSGAVTLGLSTLIGLIMLSIYVGATVKVGVVTSGWGDLVQQVGIYAPVEFVGLVGVAAAGLYPLVSAVRKPPSHSAATTPAVPSHAAGRYVAAVPRSLSVLAVGLTLILAAATAESLLISYR